MKPSDEDLTKCIDALDTLPWSDMALALFIMAKREPELILRQPVLRWVTENLHQLNASYPYISEHIRKCDMYAPANAEQFCRSLPPDAERVTRMVLGYTGQCHDECG